MVIYPGKYKLIPTGELATIDSASISAKGPTHFKAWLDEEILHDAYVGPYSPHTWGPGWNPFLGRRQLNPGSVLEIEVGPDAIFEIEGDLERI